MTGCYRDGGVWVVWSRIGARTWSTVAETEEDRQVAIAEAKCLSECRAHADEITTEEAEANTASVVYRQAGEQ